ncbi:MAG: FMN-binding protein [Lachnotalea sp.]
MTPPIKKKNNKMIKYFKIAVQITCFLLIPALFINIFQSLHNIVVEIVHPSGEFANLIPDIILLMVVTIVTAFSGRFFCGWMCAFGSMGDFIYGIRSKLYKKNTNIPKVLDYILKLMKYIILFGLIVSVWGLQITTIPSGVSPWDLFGMLLSLGNWPSLSELIQGWLVSLILLVGIITGSFIIERFFCRYFCPLGAYFAIISTIRPLTIVKKRGKCGACSLCTKKCSMGINLKKVDKIHNGECINCMSCISVCPRANPHLEITDVNVNSAVVGTTSCALIAGAVYLGTFYNDQLSLSSNSLSNIAITGTQSDKASAMWIDGTYQGTGDGFRGETTVGVTVLGGIITNIEIISTNDDSNYINRASNQILSDIITTQSSDVDTVSGATYSSNGLIDAVTDALSGATTGDSSTTTSASSTTTSASSTTISETVQTQTTQESVTTEDTETTEDVTDLQEEETTTESVAEDTSETGTLAEVQDGTYEGSGTGFRGETTVSVTVSDGAITDITILSYIDDQRYFERASDTVIEEIITNQDVSVDAVSGATYSSNGIMAAVADALNLDYTQPTITEHKRH